MNKKYSLNSIDLGFVDRIIKNYTIIVTSSNRKHVPSFHVIDIKTMGFEFDCKISFTEGRYLRNTKDILTKKQKENLIDILETDYDSLFGKRNVWFKYLYAYKISNKTDIKTHLTIPDYSQLNTQD